LNNVQLNQEAVEIDLNNRTVLFRDGSRVDYERLITTIPLPTFVKRAKGIPVELQKDGDGLHWSSLLNLTYCLRRPLPRPFHWVYFPEPDLSLFQAGFPSNISPGLTPQGAGMIAAEISNPMQGKEENWKHRFRSIC